MVSWPWKRGDDAASYEKTLAQLANKITKTSSKNESLRQQARRVNLVWILYAGFAYIVAAIFLTLVSGVQTWGPIEYTAVAGGPVVIYAVRQALNAFYTYRISSTQSSLDSLYKERDSTIEKLKTATKYDSTQQILEKYGSPRGTPTKEGGSPGGKSKRRNQNQNQGGGQRTGVPPPPTANIQRPQPQQLPPNAAPVPQGPVKPALPPDVTAEFAPNAYNGPPPSMPPPPQGMYEPARYEHRWYDRIMDVLLGDDETQARNRIVLLCGNCRLINGMAPPGIGRLEDVGRWRCRECGAWNGVEDESAKIVENLVKDSKHGKSSEGGQVKEEPETRESDLVAEMSSDNSSEEEEPEEEEAPPAKSTRSRRKG